jgi:hypothetical protein
MPSLTVNLTGDGVWPDLADRRDDIIHLGEHDTIEVAALEGGMVSGKPSVALRFDLPDSRQVVIAETSLALFLAAARALSIRFGVDA